MQLFPMIPVIDFACESRHRLSSIRPERVPRADKTVTVIKSTVTADQRSQFSRRSDRSLPISMAIDEMKSSEVTAKIRIDQLSIVLD
jgi:hypothetical protein